MEILNSRIQLHQLMNMDNMYSSPGGFEGEDDTAFYDELRRQVLLLTDEDDGGFYQNKSRNVGARGRKQGVDRSLQDQSYYDWPVNMEECPTPPWMVNLWRSAGNGTGVFIPQQIVQSRRNNRSRRKNQQRRTYKRVEKKTT